MAALPAEVCSQIVRYTTSKDLLTLCRTSRELQRAAESKLYENIVLHDANIAYQVCHALLAHDGCRGAYVKRFCFFQDTRRGPARPLLPRFWEAVQRALVAMVNLEYLFVYDPVIVNSWILDSPDIVFQLREANLGLPWNAHMVAFLETQNRLRSLHTEDSLEDGPLGSISANKLRTLQLFNGPLLVLVELLACPFTHVQITLDEETMPVMPTVISDLAKNKKGLRSLSILFIPDQVLLETLQLISMSVFTSTLRYLGTISYPVQKRHEIYRCLIRMPCLETIDLDVSFWDPQPVDVYQRMLAAELRTYCPSLQCVGFWVGQHHIIWFCQDEEWLSGQLTGRSPLNENLWRNA